MDPVGQRAFVILWDDTYDKLIPKCMGTIDRNTQSVWVSNTLLNQLLSSADLNTTPVRSQIFLPALGFAVWYTPIHRHKNAGIIP